METIEFPDFQKIELKVGTIQSAERVEGSEKLLKLSVILDEKNEVGEIKTRQILAGIGKQYEPEVLVGKQIIVVANLKPRMMMGLESQGMLLAAHDTEEGAILLTPDKEAPSGSRIS